MIVFYVMNVIAAIGISISGALFLTAWLVKKSNDIGASKGKTTDFAQSFKMIRDEDNLFAWQDRNEAQKRRDMNEFWFSSDYRGYQ
jgi:uncharacterized protein YbaA (DUF1428 family)